MPDKFRPDDDPFHVPTNLRRAAEFIGRLNARYGSGEQIAAAYFGAIDGAGNLTGASDGNVDGFEYVRRFQAAQSCLLAGLGLPGAEVGQLVSPLGTPLNRANISFGFLDDYGPALARLIRGPIDVARYGTLHFAWDLVVPGAQNNGRGSPVFAPVDGTIIRTSDPAGGPNGIWIENTGSDLRVRLMHMDALAPAIATGTRVQAGQWVGVLGGQGTEDFPHLHVSFERLSTGERIDPARFYFRPNSETSMPIAGAAYRSAAATTPLAVTHAVTRNLSIPTNGDIERLAVDGEVLVWSAVEGGSRRVRALDIGTGWTFSPGDPSAGEQFSPVVNGERLMWLDTRESWAGSKGRADSTIADVYLFDLATGTERRLTSVPGKYASLAVGRETAAWVSQAGDLQTLHVIDLGSGRDAVVDWSFSRIESVTMAEDSVIYAVAPDQEATSGELEIRQYTISTGATAVLHRGRVGRLSGDGHIVVWEEPTSTNVGSVIRSLDIRTGQLQTGVPEPAVRGSMSISDGTLLWQEAQRDGSRSLVLHGLTSASTSRLADGTLDMKVAAALGHGTLAWKTESGDLGVARLPAWDIEGGQYFSELDPGRRLTGSLGYRIADDGGIPMWSEFLRLGGEAVLGRPVTDRLQLPDGLVYQVTERALLQWNSVRGRAELANVLDALSGAGQDGQLHSRWQIPPQAPPEDGSDPVGARETRLQWLTDPAIRAAFLAPPAGAPVSGWDTEAAITRYGLPTSPPEDFGPFVAQRFQRAVLQHWNPSVPGAQENPVTLVDIGLLFRELVSNGSVANE